jgi:putative membrane protein insertion efficiency factor
VTLSGAFMLIWLIPRNVAVVFLRMYRAMISPLYGDVCRYYPSCSAYGLHSIQRFGVVRGSALGIWRIMRCNPWAAGGIDDVPSRKNEKYSLTSFGFVVSHSHGKG